MKNRIGIALGLIVSVLIIATLDEMGITPFSTKHADLNWQPQAAPDIKFQSLDGTSFSLTDFRGKVVLLNVWASWCDTCVVEFPAKLKLIRELGDKVVLIALSNDSDQKDIDNFLMKQTGINTLIKEHRVYVVWDKKSEISRKKLGVVRLPETFIINPEMQMVKKVIGATDWTNPQMVDYIKSL
jgi:thiol-disulfide isomerase/thioredoxin